MTKTEYIKNRTKYYREEYKGIKMPLRLAKECAEEDYIRYCEKYADSLKRGGQEKEFENEKSY